MLNSFLPFVGLKRNSYHSIQYIEEKHGQCITNFTSTWMPNFIHMKLTFKTVDVYILLVDFKQEDRLNFLESTIITHCRTLDIKNDGI